MTWVTTTEVGKFLAHAEPFLVADPVANTVLLTEARFWSRLSNPEAGARFGWFADGAEVRGAFVQIPDHASICSPLDAGTVASLPEALVTSTHLGVQAKDVDVVTAAWRAYGQSLNCRARLTLLRLHEPHTRVRPKGTPRLADITDRPLLRSWFKLFRERHPEDLSHIEFVVDQPLAEGGVVVWEVDGHTVAMASRTPEVAGMVRLGLAFQPTTGTTYADAAFDFACVEAARTAEHVLVLSGTAECTAHRSRGFIPVLDRVVLQVLDG